ncbi:hypothetical protein ACHHYP_09200 [Achlya hypogyna]|uniref:Secreted protein n=1 Tax=Achlya hypogyna TaxID=1202772 RepID=A0A0A7CNV4_ACHHY|nr:secreted protein [Achlya hypogyna]OQR98091.1 hypothetical protein ACHHYP_09200 [Achlya hypogyna]
MLPCVFLATALAAVTAATAPTPTFPRFLNVELNTILAKVLVPAGVGVAVVDAPASAVWQYDTMTHQLLATPTTCLDLVAGALSLAPCVNGSVSQTWTLVGSESRVVSGARQDLCLQADAVAVVAAPCSADVEGPFQYVFLTEENIVLSLAKARVLTVRDSVVVVDPRANSDARLVPSWRFNKVDGTLRSNENDLCLTATSSQGVVATDCDESSAQQWWFEGGALWSTATPNFCLTLDGPPHIAPCTHSFAQTLSYEMVDTAV